MARSPEVDLSTVRVRHSAANRSSNLARSSSAMRIGNRLLICATVALIFVQNLRAESGERYALLVGVNVYGSNSRLKELKYAASDMDSLAMTLRGLGFKPQNIFLMTQTGNRDPRFIPMKANVERIEIDARRPRQGRFRGRGVCRARAAIPRQGGRVLLSRGRARGRRQDLVEHEQSHGAVEVVRGGAQTADRRLLPQRPAHGRAARYGRQCRKRDSAGETGATISRGAVQLRQWRICTRRGRIQSGCVHAFSGRRPQRSRGTQRRRRSTRIGAVPAARSQRLREEKIRRQAEAGVSDGRRTGAGVWKIQSCLREDCGGTRGDGQKRLARGGGYFRGFVQSRSEERRAEERLERSGTEAGTFAVLARRRERRTGSCAPVPQRRRARLRAVAMPAGGQVSGRHGRGEGHGEGVGAVQACGGSGLCPRAALFGRHV